MDQYLELFRDQRALIEAHALPQLNAHRQAAADAFARLGFPMRRQERYKYTDVAAAFAPNYGMRLDAPLAAQPADEQVMALYGTLADVQSDGLVALNTMLAQDVHVIHVPRDLHKEHPIQVTHTLRSSVPLMTVRRVLIVVEAGAEAKLIFTHQADEGQDFLTSQVTEVFVGENARLELYDIEDSHPRSHRFHHLFADVAGGGCLTHGTFTLASGVVRNQTDVRLSAPLAEVRLLGGIVANGQQHVDNNTLVEHHAPQCTSHELYKYVIDDHAEGAFAGRIFVHNDAQQTESRETNANLVCTPTARMWTQPMLEIYADDVQCSHGSTVGQLADDALFYMRQRGISEAEARALLKQAFVSEVIDQVPLEALRQRLHHMTDKRFRSCEDCQLCHRHD